MSIASNIRYYRKACGFSQDYVAERLGYKSYTTIQKWESGVSEPPMKKAQELADLFGVDLDDLVSDALSPAAAPPSPEQADLLEKYDTLSDTGRELLLSRADELIRLGYTIEEEAKKDVRKSS